MASPAFLSSVLVGEGTLLLQCAEHLLNAGHEVRAIVSSEARLRDWADRHGVPRATLKDDLIGLLSEMSFDYLFSIANLTVLPPALLALPRRGAINFHDALLPKYAGLHATSWALINRETYHGVTWHEMTDRVDAGRILKQRPIEIVPGETALSLNAKCYEAGAQSFVELIDELASGTASPTEPRIEERSYFGKYERPEAGGLISWQRSAEEIAALVNGLSFGPYENPLGLPKLLLDGAAVLVTQIQVTGVASSVAPGTVVGMSDDAVCVATTTHDVALGGLMTIDGQPMPLAELVSRHGVRVGCRLPSLDREASERLTRLNAALARHEARWVERLAALEPVELPYATRTTARTGPVSYERAPVAVRTEDRALLTRIDGAATASDFVAATVAAYIARLSGTSSFSLGFGEPAIHRELAGLDWLFATQVPLRVTVDRSGPVGEAVRSILADLALIRRLRTYARDAIPRFPALRPLVQQGGRPTFPVAIEIVDDIAQAEAAPGSELTVLVSSDAAAMCWVHDPAILSADCVAAMQQQFAELLSAAGAPDTPLADISLLSDQHRNRLLVEWNATSTDYPAEACIHHQFESQVDRTPDAVAVVFEREQITYRELDARANQVARYLQRIGVGPESLVGICMERSIELVVALLGVHKAGGAYVPLDPKYPRDRLAFMVEDSGLTVLLTQERLVGELPEHHARVVCLDAEWGLIGLEMASRPAFEMTSDNLAYVIYTSGSTGKPKGVMVCHRNAVNFFAGMDERLDHDPPGVWLAVTSLSFDISVLELFWTLTRGFTVVLHGDRDKAAGRALASRPRAANKEIAFSLFYFASDEGEGVAEKYELLLEGAKFADRHGFEAVWTPERHFHAFGGLYPNPSVASAAVAAITERVKIRAGSVVLPLHSPIRVAEEWSLVDNLSRGRVGISFAAGWQPNDFAIAPHRFAERKDVMVRDIETVRRLWRGETMPFPGPNGQDVQVATLPRPVQPELPVWVTAAGSPETFRIAGRIGAGLLTHLLGQSVEELAEKLAIYRRAWREGGHPGDGHVTLMLHTFVGDDDDAVREVVRAPMKEYLRSSVDLIKKAAWSFPAFANSLQSGGQRPDEIFDSGALTDEEMEALLDHAFERYFRTSGLFGTPRTCLEMVDRLKSIDVDEIACLIDFGVPSPVALKHLAKLQELKELSRPTVGDDDFSIPAQIERHGVTHLQCTPSMASMLLMDERTSAALRPLKNVMIGGEAFPPALAAQLTALVSGDVINMYGPTETTIWSSTYRLHGDEPTIPIGRPIANTQLYILDGRLQPVPLGVPGELFIGGDGVVRGYLNRPELTAERFIHDPFSDRPDARLYRTGDLARYRPDGNVEFLGRIDHQVKIRGYRIELGEIEALLHEHPSVREAVVVAREDVPGDVRLVGYVVPAGAAVVSTADLRAELKARLPEFMVPSHFVVMDGFPLTPNAKVDRKALPAPDAVASSVQTEVAAPGNDLEAAIAGIWQKALNVARVSVNASFFDLGGHSLLMVQVQHTLRRELGRNLAITDLFRFPTIRSLAAHLSRAADDTTVIQQSVERADARRDLREQMMRRRQLRQAAVR